ncbi:DUF3299 domain-containing protein [Pseudoruegeria sp. SHC-113]|uniref:DUF3299 domain-containing protein n=1 Tax=Pseudoruegeria sp. SHC-113 TaxID=2855439 RepID=UPI0021BB2A25|nr:DUF3299 domain-containing protein [Pseudoruegeria sp. SHC-113]MCT8161142.1 DUF3299 domain-containing protein [Pseudoruegeria sp. SHC-113]
MKRLILATGLSLLLSAPVAATESEVVYWDGLLPVQEPYEDPFLDLTYEDLADLRFIYDYEQDPQKFAEFEDYPAQVEEARARLTDQGLDIQYLFGMRDIVREKRREAYESVNEDLIGKSVRIPGYMLPLQLDGRKTTEFLLVPTVGACIHTPPPAPNQVVYVTYPEGIEVTGLYTPVWITGDMLSDLSRREVNLVDGQASVDVAYRIDALKVEEYK